MAQKRSQSKSKQDKRKRSHARLLEKKNKRVEKSSHGKFKSVKELEDHRIKKKAKKDDTSDGSK